MTSMLSLIDSANFRALFVEELGWSNPDHPPLQVSADGRSFVLTQVAGFKGVRVWVCPDLPDRRTQRLIDHEVRRVSDERLLIFHNEARQEWRWPQSSDAHGKGQPRLVTHAHTVGRENPALLQRLLLVELGLDEEPTVVELLNRMRSAFDADKVTRAFYDKFLGKYKDLIEALRGINSKSDREWYSALLMNRLMFIYFMQRKGFLDGDLNYLRKRLEGLQEIVGKGHFYEFYRDFLIPLFHEGLGARKRKYPDDRIKTLVGDVPYINGGIFTMHQIEEANDIHIEDDIFRSIFDLFDQFQWHLDDRPSGNPNEINPDVLGYIFEQFINQKETGAYYTKEDVTGYMTTSTLIPVFLDRLQERTEINPWRRLKQEPETYVWGSLSFGTEQPLPEKVTAVATNPESALWHQLADAQLGLPGETWIEVSVRREAHARLLRRIELGSVINSDAAVTSNIDLEGLAIDVIDAINKPTDVVAAWEVLSALKVIDPTCGSGAFLFAAVKVLQSLYAAVLDAASVHANTSKTPALLKLLSDVGAHVNREYFVLKHATLSNLYGVDLMDEAVEIARLRLFLKLVSTIDSRVELEPLPDLDFNIKPGNILVGAVTPADIGKHSDDLLTSSTVDSVIEVAENVQEVYSAFRAAQESDDDDRVRAHRTTLSELLNDVRMTVDKQYFGIARLTGSYVEWRRSHRPFHWFLEFPEVMGSGGFDVVVGNPPYVQQNKVKTYAFKGFATSVLPDIFAPCTERAAQITRLSGRCAVIVPIASQFSADYAVLRAVLSDRFAHIWVSTFDRRPSGLFAGKVGVRSSIIICSGSATGVPNLHVTTTHRWVSEYRPALFEALAYVDVPPESPLRAVAWPRLTGPELRHLLTELIAKNPLRLSRCFVKSSPHRFGFKGNALYWLSVFDKAPAVLEPGGTASEPTMMKWVCVGSAKERDMALAVGLSKIALVWWHLTSDNLNVTLGGLGSTPVDVTRFTAAEQDRLAALGARLRKALPTTSRFTYYRQRKVYRYQVPEIRSLTDEVDTLLLEVHGIDKYRRALEHAYSTLFKGDADENGE